MNDPLEQTQRLPKLKVQDRRYEGRLMHLMGRAVSHVRVPGKSWLKLVERMDTGRKPLAFGVDGHTKHTEADHHARQQRDGFPGDET